MSNSQKIGFLVVAGLVILIGFAGFTRSVKEVEKAAENAQDGSASFVLSASMTCDDGSHFVAEFPTSEAVKIYVDGALRHTISLVSSDAGQRFEDESYIYVFAGEEVRVTDKKTGKSKVCNQPFDPNNAPVNFGDAGEGGSVKQDLSLIVSENIVGKWQSIDDAKFSREFKSDKTVVDSYVGSQTATASGTWSIFTKENKDPEFTGTLESETAYVKIAIGKEKLYFKLLKVTPEALELIYLAKGNVLRFTR